jgi:hypothetical protein
LQVTDEVLTSEFNAPLMGLTKCDSAGNVYLRQYRGRRPLVAPILRVSPDGRRTRTFPIPGSGDPNMEDVSASDFVADQSQNIYVVVYQKKKPREGKAGGDERLVVRLRSDGEPDGTIKLQPQFGARRIAAFAGGQLFVWGVMWSEDRSQARSSAVILATDGRVLATVPMASDLAGDESHPGLRTGAPAATSAISLGSVVAGDDGNIYTMRLSSSPQVQVISPGGEVLRSMPLSSPAPDYFAQQMIVGQGRLIVLYRKQAAEGRSASSIVSVFDAQTGAKLADYLAAPPLGGGLACFTRAGLVFVGEKDGKVAIRYAPIP